MFFDSYNFKMLEAGTKLSWTQQQVHMQNIANYETPNYKAKKMLFTDVLSAESAKGASSKDLIKSEIYEDQSTSTRSDGNNVNLEIENIALYKSYAQYSLLLDKVRGQFDNYGTVINNSMK